MQPRCNPGAPDCVQVQTMPPSPTSPDRDLVAAVLAATPGAFERLVAQYQGLCWHILVRLVRNPEDARELCQETFLRTYQRLPEFRFESALKTWIGHIAYSLGVRFLQQRRLALETTVAGEEGEWLLAQQAAEDDVELLASQRQAHARVHAELARLPPLQQLLVTLYHLDELSIAEIAQVTGRPENTIKVYLLRARLRLRGALADPTEQTA